jgi:long-chain acyl-CoA synthetase
MIGFWNIARVEPDVPAITEAETGKSVTRGELSAATHRLVHAMRSRGVRTNDVVAGVMDNRIESIEVFLAAMQAGLYFVPINYHLTEAEIAYILKDCEAKAVFTTPKFADTVTPGADGAGIDPNLRFCIGGADGFVDYAAAVADQPDTEPTDRSMGLMMTYTSGTTGNPKGIKRPPSGANPDEVGVLWSHPMKIFGIGEGYQVHLVQSPYYHTAVLVYVNASAQYGHSLVLMNDWEAEKVLTFVEKHKVTTSHMVPTHFHRLLKLPEDVRKRYDTSSLTYVIHGAAPCPIETKKAMIDWIGPVVYEYYGASEGGGTTTNSHDWLRYPGTVGKPWPSADIKILDEEGNPVPTGEHGLVWMLAGAFDFKYHNAPEKTASSKRGDYFTVGDIGHVNEEGFLFLHGRASDIIITGGVNIHPSEIEAVMQQHPKVADVAVFGVPDPEWGEYIQCVVQLVAGAQASDALTDELRQFCSANLAKYKLPRKIDYIDTLPRDPNGKLYKRLLKDKYVASA